jgi:uncharacterized protein Smg (DUF494 family)
MQIPIEPNLDTPIPTRALTQSHDEYEQRLKIAGNTALLLSELGMDDDLSEEENAIAAEMMAKLKPADIKKTVATKEEKSSLQRSGVALKIGGYLSEYEKQVVADKVQVRTVVVNRLMEISQAEDDKVALKALELLGKASDLFTERSEITITHKTSDELKAAIKERIQLLMQSPMKTIDTASERRIKSLEGVVDVEPTSKNE